MRSSLALPTVLRFPLACLFTLLLVATIAAQPARGQEASRMPPADWKHSPAQYEALLAERTDRNATIVT